MLPICSKGEKCTNFKFKHRSLYNHPLRMKECIYPDCKLLHDTNHTQLYHHTKQLKKLSEEEEYLLTTKIRKNCPKFDQCEDYSHIHRSKCTHPIRKKFCIYYDCKLSHDKNHMLEYNHEYIYTNVQISKKNYQYNCNHLIFGINDIWNTIHSFLFEDFNSINNLLCTSKLFKKYIKTKNKSLIFINNFNFDEKGEILYEYVAKCNSCDDVRDCALSEFDYRNYDDCDLLLVYL
jgi:hypothetical protein